MSRFQVAGCLAPPLTWLVVPCQFHMFGNALGRVFPRIFRIRNWYVTAQCKERLLGSMDDSLPGKDLRFPSTRYCPQAEFSERPVVEGTSEPPREVQELRAARVPSW